MCGIVGIVRFDPREVVEEARAQAYARRPAPSRSGRRRSVDRRAGRSRPPAPRHRRRGGRAAADGERGRHRLDHLQRRDLQPRRAPTGPGGEGASLSDAQRHRDDPAPLRGGGRRAASSGCRACSRSRSGTGGGSACSSRATGSASSRSTTRVTDRELLFASEIKAILAVTQSRPGSEPCRAPGVPRHALPRRGRDLLPRRPQAGAGSRLHLVAARAAPGAAATGRLPAGTDDSPAGLDDARRELATRLEATVRSHLMSDVPLGLFLSGGLDSSGLAALMAPMVSDRIRTFAVGFDDAASNELPYARLAAARGGSRSIARLSSRRRSSSTRSRGWSGTRTSRSRSPRACPLLRLAARARSRQGRADGRGRGRALPRLQPVPRHGLERAARSSLPGLDAAGAPRAGSATPSRSLPRAAPPLRQPELPGARSGRRGPCSTRTSRSFPTPGGARLLARPPPRRGDGSVPRAAPLLRRGAGFDPRPDEPRRSPDLPGRAPDEAGPDEHGGVDREPRAVPRSRAGRARGPDAGPVQDPRADRPRRSCARRSEIVSPARSSPPQDGLSGAVRALGPERFAPLVRSTSSGRGPSRAGCSTPRVLRAPRRRARGGHREPRRSALAPPEPRDLAAHLPRRRRPGRPCALAHETAAHSLGEGRRALAARTRAAGSGACT